MAKYSKAAQKNVGSAMKRMEKGTLKSGTSNKKVTNPKQAIAIGLSEAREKGAKVPKKKTDTKKAAPKAAKKTSPKKAAIKKIGSAKTVTKKPVAVKRKAAVKKKDTVAASKKKRDSITMMPVNPAALNTNLPPVEEKSPKIPPIGEKQEDPIMETDKKALAKAITKQDFKHHIQLSRGKQNIKSSSRKIMWR